MKTRTVFLHLLAVATVCAACSSSQTQSTGATPETPGAAPTTSGASADDRARSAEASIAAQEGSASPPQAADEQSSARPDSTPEDLRTAEQRAYEHARPVFERHCTKCHTTAGKQAKRGALRHFNMDTYPFGGHHVGEMAETIRQVLGATGQEPTMPDDDPGAVQGEDLSAVLAWADAFERSHAAGLHGAAHDRHQH